MFTLNPTDKDFLDSLEFLLKCIAGIGGVYLFFIGFKRYEKAEDWKKAEFLAKEIKEFFADVNVKRALRMLDWNIIDVPLLEGEIGDNKKIDFTDALLENSLKHHDEVLFNDEEAIVRHIMDDFLSKLGMFQSYIDSKLITETDLEPYLSYWIKIIGDINLRRKTPTCLKQLWLFINYYEYTPVIKLLKNFNYDIQINNLTVPKNEIVDFVLTHHPFETSASPENKG